MQLCEAKYRPWDERRKKGCGCARRHVPEKRKASLADNRAKTQLLARSDGLFCRKIASRCSTGSVPRRVERSGRRRPPCRSDRGRKPCSQADWRKSRAFPPIPDALALPGSCFSAFCLFLPGRKPVCGTVPSMCPLFFRFLFCNPVSNHL